MNMLIAKIIPLSIGAMISPVMLTIVLVVLAGKNYPKARAWAFFFGATIALAMITYIGYQFGQTHQVSNENNTSSISAIVDIVLGVLLIITGAIGYFKKEKRSIIPEKQDDSVKILKWVILGFAMNIFNDSMLFVLAAAKEVGSVSVSFVNRIAALIIVAFFELVPIILPLSLYLLFPGKAKKILLPINTVTQKYGKVIALVIFILFGAYITYRGIKYF